MYYRLEFKDGTTVELNNMIVLSGHDDVLTLSNEDYGNAFKCQKIEMVRSFISEMNYICMSNGSDKKFIQPEDRERIQIFMHNGYEKTEGFHMNTPLVSQWRI
jgi:hypothetical protein